MMESHKKLEQTGNFKAEDFAKSLEESVKRVGFDAVFVATVIYTIFKSN